jgi:hypothetical protein
MNTSRIVRIAVISVLVTANVTAEELDSAYLQMSGNKIVVVDVGDPQHIYLLENIEFKTIQGREFLVGKGILETVHRPAVERTVAIVWDRVVTLEIYENLESYRRHDELSDDSQVRGKLDMESQFEQFPLESKVESLRRQRGFKESNIRYLMHLIAKNEVELHELNKQVHKAELRIADGRSSIERLETDLAGGDESFEYSGATYTATAVKSDLERRKQSLRRNELKLSRLKQRIQKPREKVLQEAIAKLQDLMREQRIESENLENEVWEVEHLHENH